LGGRVYGPDEGTGKLVYEQPGNEVDGSCHSKEGGFQVSRKGEQRGAKGSKGKYAVYIIHVSFVYIME
jgi:hypothetical protein